MVASLANLGFTIYKSVNDGKDSVAYYQFLSPIVLALTMVWDWGWELCMGLGLGSVVWDWG